MYGDETRAGSWLNTLSISFRTVESEGIERILMPSKMALVDYNKCHPEKRDSGICAAALACSHGLLRQEAPFEIPMTDPFLCTGCGDCVRACPFKAISIVRM